MKNFQRQAVLAAPMAGAIAAVLAATPALAQQTIVVPTGTTDTTPKTVGGTDTVTVQTGGTLQTTTSPAINWSTTSTGLAITNSGTIRTTAAGGSAISTSGTANARSIVLTNTAGGLIEAQDDGFRIGVAATSGTIVVNNAGTIRSTGTGNGIDFAAITSTTPVVTITNQSTGIISTTSGTALLLGSGNDTVTNAGRIDAGAGGVAINLGAGNDALNLLDGSTIVGTIDGGAGTDAISLGGTNGGSFDGSVNVERLNVTSGTWAYSGTSAYSGGTFVTGGQLNVGGTLTSAATVTGGTLNNTGTVTSAVTVNTGGTYAGTGTSTTIVANTGGIVSPGVGTGIGTLTTTGAVTFNAGSTYAATLASGGTSDRIVAGSTATIATTTGGATLALSRDSGTYALGTSYTVVSATTTLTGRFTTVTQPSGGLTEFRQRVAGTDLIVDVVRTAAGVSAIAQTSNQINVATALAPLTGNANYLAVTALVSDGDARAALNLLTGEIHASARTAVLQDALRIQQAVYARVSRDIPEKIRVWAQYGLSRAADAAFGGAARVSRHNAIGIGGVEFPLGPDAVFGVSGAYSRTELGIAERNSDGTIEAVNGSAYAAARFGGFRARVSAGYMSADVTTQRNVTFTGLAEKINARSTNLAIHGFGEAAYAFEVGDVAVGPYARLSAIRVLSPDFAEGGGSSALTAYRRVRTTAISNVGIDGKTALFDKIDLHGAVGWQHGFGQLTSHTDFVFANGGLIFGTDGSAFSRDAVQPSLNLSYRVNPRVNLFVGYSGTFGDRGHDHNGRVGVSARL